MPARSPSTNRCTTRRPPRSCRCVVDLDEPGVGRAQIERNKQPRRPPAPRWWIPAAIDAPREPTRPGPMDERRARDSGAVVAGRAGRVTGRAGRGDEKADKAGHATMIGRDRARREPQPGTIGLPRWGTTARPRRTVRYKRACVRPRSHYLEKNGTALLPRFASPRAPRKRTSPPTDDHAARIPTTLTRPPRSCVTSRRPRSSHPETSSLYRGVTRIDMCPFCPCFRPFSP